jgi:hypothetical protein
MERLIIRLQTTKSLCSIRFSASLFCFLDKHHPEWGIVKDRASEWAPSSIASTGFAIPCFAIGVERNWMEREEAAQITLNMLNFFKNSEQSAAANATGYKGFTTTS